MNVIVTPIVVGHLGKNSKGLVERLGKLKIRGGVETIQIIAHLKLEYMSKITIACIFSAQYLNMVLQYTYHCQSISSTKAALELKATDAALETDWTKRSKQLDMRKQVCNVTLEMTTMFSGADVIKDSRERSCGLNNMSCTRKWVSKTTGSHIL